MNRKNASAPKTEIPQPHPLANGRAARAAARVAARYANAPSYSEMLTEEACIAMRAARVAQRAADDAHAAVQMVLAGLEAASPDSYIDASLALETLPDPQPGPKPASAPQSRSQSAARAVAVPAPTLAPAAEPEDDPFAEMRLAPPLDPSPAAQSFLQPGAVDQSKPIPANLIQFPREIVATRRLRPRLAEGPLAEHESAPQLSIFEVDPGAVSTRPAAPALSESAAPAWMQPEWTVQQAETQAAEALLAEPEPETVPVSPVVDLAPVERRLLSIVIDGALSLAAFAGLVRLAAPAARFLHSPRIVEVCVVLAVLLAFAGYQSLFASLTKVTPGMWYAGIGLCTLNGYVPERPQRCARLLALLLSVLPLGLGLAWSMFDEDRLTWHDRLSGTYLRMR
jgi:uncharacterized RDD family membrane protein YckC